MNNKRTRTHTKRKKTKKRDEKKSPTLWIYLFHYEMNDYTTSYNHTNNRNSRRDTLKHT